VWLALAGLAVAGACQCVALGYDVTRPADVGAEQGLASWLAAHHLTRGLGTYTEDNTPMPASTRRRPRA
jgi:hypothetical protein